MTAPSASAPKRRVLFASAPFGLAPKRAVDAVATAMGREFADIETRALDIFDYVNPAARAVLQKGYETLTTSTPSLWGFLYEKESLVDSLSPADNFVRSIQWEALRGVLAENPPAAIVVSHPFAAAPFLKLKREGSLDVPVVSLLTDFHGHNAIVQDGVSLYTCADASLVDELVKRGIDRELVYPCGIPVEDAFTSAHAESRDRDALRVKYGVDPTRRTLLVIGQGLDPDVADRMLFQLSLLKTPTQFLLTTGNNTELSERFRRYAAIYGVRAKLFGQVEFLPELVAIADLAITHGGGLTAAECLASGVPLVILEPVPGQETRNTRFLVSSGAARQAAGVLSLGAEVDFALGDAEVFPRMRRAAQELGKPSAARDAGRAIYLAAQNAPQILERERERAKRKTEGVGQTGVGQTGPTQAAGARPLFEEIGGEQATASVPTNVSRGAAKDLLVGWIMNEKDARRRYEEVMSDAERWQRRAELAVREGQDDLAKAALKRSEETRREAIGLEQELRRIAAEKAKITQRAQGSAGAAGGATGVGSTTSGAEVRSPEMESRFRKMELDDELRRLKRKLDEGGERGA